MKLNINRIPSKNLWGQQNQLKGSLFLTPMLKFMVILRRTQGSPKQRNVHCPNLFGLALEIEN